MATSGDHELAVDTTAAEESDENWLAEIPDLARLERTVRTAPPEKVRRALLATITAQNLPVALLITAAVYGGAPRDRMLRIVEHPTWNSWGQDLVPILKPSQLVITVASAAALLMQPYALERAEEYADLLSKALIANVEEWSTTRPFEESHVPDTAGPVSSSEPSAMDRSALDLPPSTH